MNHWMDSRTLTARLAALPLMLKRSKPLAFQGFGNNALANIPEAGCVFNFVR